MPRNKLTNETSQQETNWEWSGEGVEEARKEDPRISQAKRMTPRASKQQ